MDIHGSLGPVLEADPRDLSRVGGLNPNAAQILRNVQNDAKDQPICVVLMHDTNATHETVKALPDILEWFAAKGYRFFTVQQMAE